MLPRASAHSCRTIGLSRSSLRRVVNSATAWGEATCPNTNATSCLKRALESFNPDARALIEISSPILRRANIALYLSNRDISVLLRIVFSFSTPCSLLAGAGSTLPYTLDSLPLLFFSELKHVKGELTCFTNFNNFIILVLFKNGQNSFSTNGSKSLCSFMSDNWFSFRILQNAAKDWNGKRILKLSQTIGNLMFQQGGFITKCLGNPINTVLSSYVFQSE